MSVQGFAAAASIVLGVACAGTAVEIPTFKELRANGQQADTATKFLYETLATAGIIGGIFSVGRRRKYSTCNLS